MCIPCKAAKTQSKFNVIKIKPLYIKVIIICVCCSSVATTPDHFPALYLVTAGLITSTPRTLIGKGWNGNICRH